MIIFLVAFSVYKVKQYGKVLSLSQIKIPLGMKKHYEDNTVETDHDYDYFNILGNIDLNAIGRFPLYLCTYNVKCEDQISLKLTMSAMLDSGKKIVDNLEFECKNFPYYNDVHYILP